MALLKKEQIDKYNNSDMVTVIKSMISDHAGQSVPVDDTPVNGSTTTPISSNWAYDHNAGATHTDLDPTFEATFVKKTDVDDTPVDGETTVPVSSNWAYDHNAGATHTDLDSTFEATFCKKADIDDTPVDSETSAPISSNWAYDNDQQYCHVCIHTKNYYTIPQGTWVWSGISSYAHGIDCSNSSSAINDAIQFKVWLRAGYYQFVFYALQNTSGGIMTCYIDSNSAGTVDFYAGSNQQTVLVTGGYQVTTTGLKTIELKMTGTSGANYTSHIVDSFWIGRYS